MIRTLAVTASIGLLAACMQTPAANEASPAPVAGAGSAQPDPLAGPCDAARVQDVIGKPAREVSADAQRRANARSVRVIGPGDAVTMDYRTDRLNLDTNERGIVTAVRCG